MKKVLIIGAAGFVGNYLIERLLESSEYEVHATKLPAEKISWEDSKEVQVHNLNILEREAITNLLFEIRPEYIFHLAAQSSVSVAWNKPGMTIDINIKGGVNVLDAVREMYYKPRVLMIGSGEEYGHIKQDEVPITEDNKLRPGNIYAATKACQNMISRIYYQAYDMDVMMVRAFNHIGPRQSSIFVISDFCRQVAEIELGLREPVMRVGNLAARRDFTDVRDVVNAYILLMKHGEAGETYNVGSGHAYEIQEVLDKIIALSDHDISVEIDQNKIRPVDVPIIEANITKLVETTGWNRTISLEQTLIETLNYWRNILKEENNGKNS